MLVILTTAGEEITTTADHPFYVKNHGFVNASDLFIGDKLLDSNGKVLLVEEVTFETATEPTTVYNFQVEDFHTYHVGCCGVLVHNANCKLIANSDGTYDAELSYKDDWTPEQKSQADAKCKSLTEADTRKTNVEGKRNARKTSLFRKEKNISSSHDVDHIIDLQLGGADGVNNMTGLDRSVNRSLGSQINHLIGSLPENTAIIKFYMK